jgi:hypothetical protein
MDITEILQQLDIRQLQSDLEHLRQQHDRTSWDLSKVKDLAEENLELKLRLGLLVRLLIARGVFTAEEYASLIAEAHRQQ